MALALTGTILCLVLAFAPSGALAQSAPATGVCDSAGVNVQHCLALVEADAYALIDSFCGSTSPQGCADGLGDEALATEWDKVDALTQSEACAVEMRAEAANRTMWNSLSGDPTSTVETANCNDYHTTTYRADSEFPYEDSATNGSYSHKVDNRLAITHCTAKSGFGTDHHDDHCSGVVLLDDKSGQTRSGTKFTGSGGAGDSVGGTFRRQPGYPVCTSTTGTPQNAGLFSYTDTLYADCYYKYG
jgi:hypothetical protein